MLTFDSAVGEEATHVQADPFHEVENFSRAARLNSLSQGAEAQPMDALVHQKEAFGELAMFFTKRADIC